MVPRTPSSPFLDGLHRGKHLLLADTPITQLTGRQIYRHSAGLVAFSPGANWILTAVQDRLIVRRTDTFLITRTWLVDATPSTTASAIAPLARSNNNPEPITHAAWACDSEYLLAACAKHGVVSVFKMRDEEWRGRIEAGAEGLVKAEWAPDGRSILCFSEWGVSTLHQRFRCVKFQRPLAAESYHLVPGYRNGDVHPIPGTSR